MAKTTGRFFLTNNRPVQTESRVDGSAFRLVLRVLDRQGDRAVEGYEVAWSGPAAAAWWAENQTIQPGAALYLELLNPRAMPGHRGPVITATVLRCERAPFVPAGAADTQQHQTA